MIVFPNAKINLGLEIVGRREDGYHLLDSLFCPIGLCDVLELHPAEAGAGDSLTVYGDVETGAVEDNLVLRAVRALRSRWDFPAVTLYLYKHIPSGAGMGGGSSDATFTLRALRELFELEVSDDELREVAVSLGADCPFFVANRTCLVSGIGEVYAEAPALSLEDLHLVVIKPSLHVSTRDAFAGLKRIGGQTMSVGEIVQKPLDEWREHLQNAFEESLFPLHPELANVKAWLYDHGARYASMTGSGAALYGLFDSEVDDAVLATLPAEYFVWKGRVLAEERWKLF